MEFLSKLFPKAKTPLLFAAFLALVATFLLKEVVGSIIPSDNAALEGILSFVFFFFISAMGVGLFANMANHQAEQDTQQNTNENTVTGSIGTTISNTGLGHKNTVSDSEATHITNNSSSSDTDNKKKA